jgi:ubiquinone/menaquinone biosynthesis C-methylase UbiE
MSSTPPSGQSETSVRKNSAWFDGNADYAEHVASLDTYKRLRAELDSRMTTPGLLLDIGNGGVFDYDTTLAENIVALDLFLEESTIASLPPNVRSVRGSALDLPFDDASFDTVFMSMLLHHLTGSTVAECQANLDQAIAECGRVVKPNGRVLIVESCVPSWFHSFETMVFRPATAVAAKLIEHPMTFQHTAHLVATALRRHFTVVSDDLIPKGRWILQFGYRVPSFITPVEMHIFEAHNGLNA